jgi:hypothetical protein
LEIKKKLINPQSGVTLIVLISVSLSLSILDMRNLLNWVFVGLCEIIRAVLRDLKGVLTMIKTKRRLKAFERGNSSVFVEFAKLTRQQPNKPCIVLDDQTWTFKDVNESG